MDDDGRMSEASSAHNRGRASLMGDLEDAASASHVPTQLRPQLRCNACWDPLLSNPQSAQTCYRTSCSHIFCEKCAYKHFGGGRLVCPACRTDCASRRGGGVFEATIHGVADAKRSEAIWEEMIANPSSCFGHFQQALDFIMFQLAQDAYRQEDIRRKMAEEQKSFQAQHGEKYIQLKAYTDQLEAELRESKTKMQALNTSNEELREAYKEKSRKCRNWEKMCKTLKTQSNGGRHYPSPVGSTTSAAVMMPRDGPIVAASPQFSRPIMRPITRAYPPVTSSAMIRPHMGIMQRPETPGLVKRPTAGVFDRFARPQLGGTRPAIHAVPSVKQRINRPKTPLQLTQRTGYLSKRPNF